MSVRINNWNLLKDHPVFKSAFNKLKVSEHKDCIKFIKQNDSLIDEEFNITANRWMLDEPNKPKNHTTMWALVTACNDLKG